jgi:hypothetical protein
LANRSCEVVCAVVGNDREDVTFVFWPEEPGLSGIVGEFFDNKEGAVVQQGKAETRRTVTLEEVLRRAGARSTWRPRPAVQPSALRHYRLNVLTVERPKQALNYLLV